MAVERNRTGGLPQRLVRLYAGLTLFGVSLGLMVPAGLGLAPWDVFHQGLSRLTGISLGLASILVSAAVLALWIPLRERPGLGTVSNVLVVGAAIDATLAVMPDLESLAVRVPVLVGAVIVNGMATGMYITARFGAGPRDGLMTGLNRVTGRSVRLVRSCIEIAVLLAGIALGGTAGVGTVLYALGIGPLSQLSLRLFTPAAERSAGPRPAAARGGGAADFDQPTRGR